MFGLRSSVVDVFNYLLFGAVLREINLEEYNILGFFFIAPVMLHPLSVFFCDREWGKEEPEGEKRRDGEAAAGR